MTVSRLLGVLSHNCIVELRTERGKFLYRGQAYMLDSRYLLSCLVIDAFIDAFIIVIIVTD
ncbi:MAG: hypothetical protein IJ736_03100 [Firmicutes bacterium]|nr:hypothetical protein [Bacillota bacterium]